MLDRQLPNGSANWKNTSQGGSPSDKYYILMELGQGGTAIVNAAIARGLAGFSKLVVLKQTKREFGEHRDAVGMFLNEAKLSARMNHPNVVQVYEVFEDNGLPVIVMEYLEGLPLSKILQRLCQNPMLDSYSVDVLISIVCKALEGLHYAHTLSDFNGEPLEIVHRDATPHNLMVTYTGQVKLLDFGIAKLSVSSDETKTGVIKGKLGYMPKEQVDGSQVDCRADVFAIGVILWECIARRRLWEASSDAMIMHNLISDKIPRLADVVTDVDPELDRICARAMAPEPEDRYATAQALLADLESFLGPRGGVASAERISTLVSDSCGDMRDAAKEKLNEELAKFSESSDGSWDTAESFSGLEQRAHHTIPATPKSKAAPEFTGDEGYLQVYQQSIDHKPHRVRRFVIPALAVVGLVGLWAFRVYTETGVAGRGQVRDLAPRAIVSSDSSGSEPAVSAEAVSVPRVRVVVAAVPSEAAIFLDDVQVASNPHSEFYDRDEGEHTLRVEAPGYEPQRRNLSFVEDQNVVVELAKVAPPPGPAKTSPPASAQEKVVSKRPQRRKPSRKRPAPKPERTSPVVADKQSPQCDPPYFIDSAGIKQYRRECL